MLKGIYKLIKFLMAIQIFKVIGASKTAVKISKHGSEKEKDREKINAIWHKD